MNSKVQRWLTPSQPSEAYVDGGEDEESDGGEDEESDGGEDEESDEKAKVKVGKETVVNTVVENFFKLSIFYNI